MKYPSIQELYSIYKQHPVISTDSRKIIAGSLFFALKGDQFDGNKFAAEAIRQGAVWAVIDDEKQYGRGRCILVKNVLAYLQELAQYHRSQINIPFIAITGSNGKTTTKELIRSVLSQKYKVHATVGNLNNHIGVPLTLLSIGPETEITIIEMGANHPGEIASLCDLAAPDYGIITNIGRAHIGEFGSFENIVKAKTEMYDFIRRRNGKIFIHSLNKLLMSKSEGMERITYGEAGSDFCQCKYISAGPFLNVQYEGKEINTRLIGKYNFENVAAAICIGKYFGVEPAKIKKSLEEYVPSNNRSQVVQTRSHTLIMDAYNANPSSMRAAIDNFSEMKGNSKWLILGDMLELGQYEAEEHRKILQLLLKRNFNKAILVGERFMSAGTGMDAAFSYYKSADELAAAIRKQSPFESNSLILIKGSRGIKLEKLAELL